jgi:hypothetical protein
MAAERIGEVVVDDAVRAIELNTDTGRIELWVGNELAFIRFHFRNSVLALIHTEVPPALQHKGLAEALARVSLEYARARDLKVNPICPYVLRFLSRHPEFQNVRVRDDE